MFWVGKYLMTLVYAGILSFQSNAPQATCSWYGGWFHGRQTASGLFYDMYEISCAHKTLPLGTWVAFWNPENNRFIIAQITDRGPYVWGRDFDLSRGAFDYLTDGDLDRGLVNVYYIVLDRDTEGMPYPNN